MNTAANVVCRHLQLSCVNGCEPLDVRFLSYFSQKSKLLLIAILSALLSSIPGFGKTHFGVVADG